MVASRAGTRKGRKQRCCRLGRPDLSVRWNPPGSCVGPGGPGILCFSGTPKGIEGHTVMCQPFVICVLLCQTENLCQTLQTSEGQAGD